MNNWFECKISFDKTLENGLVKKVTESYLVDALSFTEAEARIIQEMTPFISGDFTVAAVGRKKLSELFLNENGDIFYIVKIYYLTLDEKSGTEKKTAVQMLVQANNLKEALSIFENDMKDTMADYQIVSVVETAFMDVFPYIKKE